MHYPYTKIATTFAKRFKFRKPQWEFRYQLLTKNYGINEAWRQKWDMSNSDQLNLISDPTTGPERIMRDVTAGDINLDITYWPNCNCGNLQTRHNIAVDCCMRKFPGTIQTLHLLEGDASDWTWTYTYDFAYSYFFWKKTYFSYFKFVVCDILIIMIILYFLLYSSISHMKCKYVYNVYFCSSCITSDCSSNIMLLWISRFFDTKNANKVSFSFFLWNDRNAEHNIVRS